MKWIVLPQKQGLYDPTFEHDACGIGFVAHIEGIASYSVVKQDLSMLCRLEHRGGRGSDPLTGDGAGIMVQLPHKFFQVACSQLSMLSKGDYSVGMLFLPQEAKKQRKFERMLKDIITEEGQELLSWRTVPVDGSALGEKAKVSQPAIR